MINNVTDIDRSSDLGTRARWAARLVTALARLGRDTRGATMVEYAVLVGLLSAGAITLIVATGENMSKPWTTLADSLPGATDGTVPGDAAAADGPAVTGADGGGGGGGGGGSQGGAGTAMAEADAAPGGAGETETGTMQASLVLRAKSLGTALLAEGALGEMGAALLAVGGQGAGSAVTVLKDMAQGKHPWLALLFVLTLIAAFYAIAKRTKSARFKKRLLAIADHRWD